MTSIAKRAACELALLASLRIYLAIACGRGGCCIEQPLDLGQRRAIVSFGSNRCDVHAGNLTTKPLLYNPLHLLLAGPHSG